MAAVFLLAFAALAQQKTALIGYNGLTLAGLRPGKDSLAAALKHYKAKYSSGNEAESQSERQWDDPCTGHSLRMTVDVHGIIQEITVSSLIPLDGKCRARLTDLLDENDWVTGHGLHLGDSQDHVSELYGEPDSSGPSVRDKNELEFLYYPFASAGSDVPQAMQIYCARDSGKVVEITLAFAKL